MRVRKGAAGLRALGWLGLVSGLTLMGALRDANAISGVQSHDRRLHNLAIVAVVASRLGVDPALAVAVGWVESGGRSGLRGRAGEVGLMQVMPATGRDLGVHEPNMLMDPRLNAVAGVQYLKLMLAQFGGDPALALSAYNSGPNATRRAGRVTRQSRAYVARALGIYRRVRACGADHTLSECLQGKLLGNTR